MNKIADPVCFSIFLWNQCIHSPLSLSLYRFPGFRPITVTGKFCQEKKNKTKPECCFSTSIWRNVHCDLLFGTFMFSVICFLDEAKPITKQNYCSYRGTEQVTSTQLSWIQNTDPWPPFAFIYLISIHLNCTPTSINPHQALENLGQQPLSLVPSTLNCS